MPNTKVVKRNVEFSRIKWHNERVHELRQIIRDELIAYSSELNMRTPTEVQADVSPNLADELSFGDVTDFACTLLGVPVRFAVNWTLTKNFMRLTIS